MLGLSLLSIQTISAQKRPSWTYNKPDAPNETFTYRVEWGAGENIIVAYNQALTKIINSTANAIGVNTSTGAIKDALESGDSFDVISGITIGTCVEKSRRGHSFRNLPVTDE